MDNQPAIIIDLGAGQGLNGLILTPGGGASTVIVPEYQPNSHIQGSQHPGYQVPIIIREYMGKDPVVSSPEEYQDDEGDH